MSGAGAGRPRTTSGYGNKRATVVSLLDARVDKLFQPALDVRDVLAGRQPEIDRSAQIGRHLRLADADDQAVLRALGADEEAGFEDDVVARGCRPFRADQRIVLAEHEDAAAAAVSRLLDLLENRSAGLEIHRPVVHGGAGAFEAQLDLRGDAGALAA